VAAEDYVSWSAPRAVELLVDVSKWRQARAVAEDEGLDLSEFDAGLAQAENLLDQFDLMRCYSRRQTELYGAPIGKQGQTSYGGTSQCAWRKRDQVNGRFAAVLPTDPEDERLVAERVHQVLGDEQPRPLTRRIDE
jgi:hypothetical protein